MKGRLGWREVLQRNDGKRKVGKGFEMKGRLCREGRNDGRMRSIKSKIKEKIEKKSGLKRDEGKFWRDMMEGEKGSRGIWNEGKIKTRKKE